MASTPMAPTISPAIWLRPGNRRNMIEATAAATSGTPEFNIPATDEEMCAWASGNMVIGMSIQVTAKTHMRRRSARSIDLRA